MELRTCQSIHSFLDYRTDIGSFQVLTPRKKIQSQETQEVSVRFAPMSHKIFYSTCIISAQEKPNLKITLNLHGEGASPEISLSQTSLDFGNVIVGQPIVRTISVQNNAQFDLKYLYELVPDATCNSKNFDHSEAFQLLRLSEKLSQNSSGEIILKFLSDNDNVFFNKY